MKSLYQTNNHGKARKLTLLSFSFSVAVATVGLFMIVLAFHTWNIQDNLILKQAEMKADDILTLATEICIRQALQMRESLEILAINPAIKDMKKDSFFQSAFNKSWRNFERLLDSCKRPMGILLEEYLAWEDMIKYWLELPKAAFNRILFSIFLLTHDIDAVDVSDFALAKPLRTQTQYNKLSAITTVIEIFLDESKKMIKLTLESQLIRYYLFIEKTFGIRKQILTNRKDAENLLNVVLSNSNIKSFIVKNINGATIAIAGENLHTKNSTNNQDWKAIKDRIPFFCGHVKFNLEHKYPLWLISVPIRDKMREPTGYLSAFVDISYLNNIASKLSDSGQLIFVDSEFSVIGHRDKEKIALKNALTFLPPNLEGNSRQKEISHRVTVTGKNILQTSIPLKMENIRYLPNWYIFYEQNLPSLEPLEYFLEALVVILLAGTGLIVLSYGIVKIFGLSI